MSLTEHLIYEDLTKEEYNFLVRYRLFKDLMEPGEHIYIMTSDFSKSQIQTISAGLQTIANLYNDVAEV